MLDLCVLICRDFLSRPRPILETLCRHDLAELIVGLVSNKNRKITDSLESSGRKRNRSTPKN